MSKKPKKLVIVESPAKARTIEKILGATFTVKSSVGHIRDLPEHVLGVDIQNGFTPKYVVPKGKTKVINELSKAVKACEAVFLAPDPDREGEAIAWHLHEALAPYAGEKPFFRITYNEITPRAVKRAIEQPGEIDMCRVNAQQARRVLDRIVGYKVSPLLWRRIQKGLSAGRVQSVALRLVAEREREIQAFQVTEYWLLGAILRRTSKPLDPFNVRLARLDGEKPVIPSEERANELLADLQDSRMRVQDVKVSQSKRHPLPPFITSTLQQAASSLFSFPPARTMRIAQKLYEEGLITYMRTDSVNVSREALETARSFISSEHGPTYLPAKPNYYKSRAGAQEAHEAIRCTDVLRTPASMKGSLESAELRLYDLIWRRFVASQMTPAQIERRTVGIVPEKPNLHHEYLFTASASSIIFDGFLRVMSMDIRKRKNIEENNETSGEDDEVDQLPPLVVGDITELIEWVSERKETKPPPRYSEASLIRALESNGVGRPSTYASIIETIKTRRYTLREKRQLVPTELGLKVNDLLIDNLSQLFDVGFTAEMEEELDRIEAGKIQWDEMLRSFHTRFQSWMDATREPSAAIPKVRAIIEMLDEVVTWNPEVKRGKRTYSDNKFVTSIRRLIDKQNITERQLIALAKIAFRYRDQIDNAESKLSALGFDTMMKQELQAPSTEEATSRFALIDNLSVPALKTDFITSLRQQVESGVALTQRQLAALDRIITQNAAHIPNFKSVCESLGISFEDHQGESDTESADLLELLKHVERWQEPVRRGKMTFDDQIFYQSLDSQYQARKFLTHKQRSALLRMVVRYKRQIPKFDQHAARLGLQAKSSGKEKDPPQE